MRRQQICLEHLSGPKDALIVRFSKQRVVIGRAENCDLVLDYDPTVSRQHACISSDGEQLFIEDLGSTHGTFVDGQRITQRTQLTQGAIIRVGNSYLRVP